MQTLHNSSDRPRRSRRSVRARSVRTTAIAAALTAVAIAATACGGGAAAGSGGDTITIGALQPLSGSVKFLGDETLNGMNLAIKQINDQGGIKALGGAKFKLVTADSSSSDTSAATTAASQLLNQRPAVVMAPTDSTTLLPSSTVFERADVAQCTSSFADAITSRGYKTIFQVPTRSSDVGKATADSLSTILPQLGEKVTKVAVLFDATNPATQTTVLPIESKLKSNGYDIVYRAGFNEGLTSAAPLATAIKASGAQVLVDGAAAPSDALVINRALDQQGVKIPILLPGGGLATSAAYLNTLGPLANGSFTVMQWNYSMNLGATRNKLLQDAQRQFVAMNKSEPFMDEFAGEAYVCTWLFADAMEQAKSADPATIVKTLHSAEFADGPASLFPPGSVKFNDQGLNERAVNIVGEWCHNKLQTVYPPKYATMSITPSAQCK
jgi:branched-chain amino acid transport system substrate-binding protein